ncbi:redox-sensitive transcriptional activator SoxR [Acinetobacter brisouii CIP 110357]|uniref:Redox-sensitive transcriptional activator SoxR n=1 Tax=Acinetobacter brisouii CIP 110357 TaxID=1341683 RepID=V2UUT6_9GAMM|nr:redox-sensitive transcriptional activator SoxR [Acinetobacter brisouii]ENV46422.1 redox-sensitive transcriptional activator SoxR [Acinetobacter brisouii ANC 4119]ESK52410.1 redox-sensitive transcriptional activator SoxR [Acinetobacter brisouii CIP 110357]
MSENSMQAFIGIGELAKRSGVSVASLRFYEEKQLIWSTRTNGNQRRYLRAMLRRVAIIKVAQSVGISLDEVKQAFAVLPDHQVASKQDWQRMSSLWKTQLDEKIQTLLQLRQQLDWCIGCGCLSLEQCPLRNPDDCLAEKSAGAHFQQILALLDASVSSDVCSD